MIGQKSKSFDWIDFVKGMTTTNYSLDGGFSVGTIPTDGLHASVVNLTVTPGVINFPEAAVDASTDLTGQFIASSEDPAASATRLLVSSDGNQDGRFYSAASNGVLTQRGSADTGHNYIKGRTDIIGFQGEAYVSNDQTLVRWQQPATFNTSFFSFSDAFAPHPALVFEDNAFYGDGNELLRQTAAGGAPSVILTLPSNQVITALGIDPGSGRMLISIIDEYNISDSISSQARVDYYDGFSAKVLKVVLVDDMIEAFYAVGGTVYVGYGTRLGYWNGAGIEFLRKLNVSFDNNELPYKHNFTNIGNVLYLVEKNRILCYGEIIKGAGKVFWYTYQNAPSGVATNLTFATNFGNTNIAFSYATSKFALVSMTSTSNANGEAYLYMVRLQFDRPVSFQNFVVDYTQALPTNGTIVGRVTMDIDNDTIVLGNISTTESNKKTFELPYPGTATTRSFQCIYTVSNGQVMPIDRITVFWNEYD